MSEEEIIKEIESLSPSEEAIQGLLDLYNKEKEKNKELENEKDKLIDLLREDKFIYKYKIREKIKELENIRKSMEDYILVSSHSANIQAVDERIQVLQELLEERN